MQCYDSVVCAMTLVCLSICHKSVFCQSGQTYYHANNAALNQGLKFYDAKDLVEIFMRSPPTRVPDAGGESKIGRCGLDALLLKMYGHRPRWSTSAMVAGGVNTKIYNVHM